VKVLIIEDDSIQATRLESLIQSHFSGVSVDKVATELEFRKRLPGIADGAYKVALVDMMLRWTDPSPDMEPPAEDVIEEGFFVGGLRCRRALLAKNIPSIVFTVLNSENLPKEYQDKGIDFIQKGPSFQPILDKLKGYLC
jgi:CheY-like chemotaxis protein